MAFKTTSAFIAGVATGWVLRSAMGSSREVLVRVVVVAHRGRERLRRVVAENAEWLDDLFAEGRARYNASHSEVGLDDEAPPHIAPERERAA
jgi:hypothetical protein